MSDYGSLGNYSSLGSYGNYSGMTASLGVPPRGGIVTVNDELIQLQSLTFLNPEYELETFLNDYADIRMVFFLFFTFRGHFFFFFPGRSRLTFSFQVHRSRDSLLRFER